MLNYYYFLEDEDNGLKYTVDMLRLFFYIYPFEHKPFLEECKKYFFDSEDENKKMYNTLSNKIGLYADNFVIDHIWIGVGCNNPNSKQKDKILVTFEFNPNKVENFGGIFQFLKKFKDKTYLKRFDLAIDIPENINNLEFENLKKRASTVYYQYQSNKTIYFGKGSGHTKIYNKMIESQLDYELTRYEVTKEVENISLINFDISRINIEFLNAIKKPYNEHTSDKTHNAIAFALNNGYHFKDLSRDMQKNIRLECSTKYDFRQDLTLKVLFQTVTKLFA